MSDEHGESCDPSFSCWNAPETCRKPDGAHCAVATCSPAVPVCELENLAESWLHRHATSLEPTGNLLYCRDELRRLIAAAKKRQPQENTKVSHDGA